MITDIPADLGLLDLRIHMRRRHVTRAESAQRDQAILRLIAEGKSLKEAAYEIGCPEEVCRKAAERLRRRLGVRTNAQAVLVSYREDYRHAQ